MLTFLIKVYILSIMILRSNDIAQYLEPAHSCVCFNLRKSARAVTQRYEEALKPTGLRATQFSLLVATRLMGSITVSSLAKALVMDRTTLTRNLKPLEKQGLLRISLGRDDRREREITLTGSGQAILAKALPLWQGVQGEVKKELGQARFNRLLHDLSATIMVSPIE